MPVLASHVHVAITTIAAVLRVALVFVGAPIAPALAATLMSPLAPLLPAYLGHVPVLDHPP
jgi:hypothetical protein